MKIMENVKKLETKHYLIVSTILVIVFAVAATTTMAAFDGGRGFDRHGHDKEGKNFDPVKHEAVETALESGDYEAWKTAMADMPFADKIMAQVTAENFAKFAEAHTLMAEGDREASKAIMEELGIALMGGRHDMRGRHDKEGKNFDPEKFEEIKVAVESGDYETWKSLISDMQFGSEKLDVITADNFAQYQEAHNLREAGDFEGSKVIMNELGIQLGRGQRAESSN